MGITYFACAYPSDLVDEVFNDPRVALTINPTFDYWAAEHRKELPTLDLDKMWHSFQAVTAPPPKTMWFHYPRPAYRMFEGGVAGIDSAGMEWFPWVRVISPDETAVISRDLATLDPVLLAKAETRRYGPSEYMAESCAQFLKNAQTFTNELIEDGLGFVYSIG